MPNQQLAISVLCGGQSTEHAVSIQSARNVVAALDHARYEVSVIVISQQGSWYRLHQLESLQIEEINKLSDTEWAEPLVLMPGEPSMPFRSARNAQKRYRVDCVLPILHGSLGEDGALQGLLELLNLPYVGGDVLSSAVCMAKHASKALLRAQGLPVVDWTLLESPKSIECDYALASQKLGPVLFVKPASLGSSVGMNKVANKKQFNAAIKEAFQFDEQVLLEPYIEGREIECAVLGNDEPQASALGEVVPQHDYYSYQAKYIDPNGAVLQMPAQLDKKVAEKIQAMAIQAFKVLGCYGLARVDFFLTSDNKIFINELNTLPGFTGISMYPKLWELSGLPVTRLLDRLIDLALERFHKQQALTRTYSP